MRVIGIDPGSINTGYGVVESEKGGAPLVHVAHGVISPGKLLSPAERLYRISEGLKELISEYRPDAASVESVFFAKNVKSAIMLGQARGAALVAAAGFAIPIHEYAARAVKLAVTGYGNAEKEQVQKMITLLLKMESFTGKADSSDALALAVCHINSWREGAQVAARPSRGPLSGRVS